MTHQNIYLIYMTKHMEAYKQDKTEIQLDLVNI